MQSSTTGIKPVGDGLQIYVIVTLIKLNQASTKRRIIWILTGICGALGWWMDKDITPIIILGTTVAGGLGVSLDDS